MGSTLVHPQIGQTLAYVEFNTDVTISANTEATANVVVTAPSLNFNGVDQVWIEFYAPATATAASSAAQIWVSLYDNGSVIVANQGMAQSLSPAAAALGVPFPAFRKITPTAGAHVYDIRGWRQVGNATIKGTAGGLSQPGYIKITAAT